MDFPPLADCTWEVTLPGGRVHREYLRHEPPRFEPKTLSDWVALGGRVEDLGDDGHPAFACSGETHWQPVPIVHRTPRGA